MQLVVTPMPDVKDIQVFRNEKLIAKWYRAFGRLIHLGEIEIESGDKIITNYLDGRKEEVTR